MNETQTFGAINWFRGDERRISRRHDLMFREIPIHRVDDAGRKLKSVGYLVDLSASGARFRTRERNLIIGSTLRVSVELPDFAGISPFVDRSGPHIRPKREWTGDMTVIRLSKLGGELEVGARLNGIDELDRGMLSLYLSTQPLAA